jgi:hypothetical protein
VPAPDGVRSLRLLPARRLKQRAAARSQRSLQRMLVEIPLTEEENAAAQSDQ